LEEDKFRQEYTERVTDMSAKLNMKLRQEKLHLAEREA
jgi:hypothetical protein